MSGLPAVFAELVRDFFRERVIAGIDGPGGKKSAWPPRNYRVSKVENSNPLEK